MEGFEQFKKFPKILTVIWWFVYLPLAALEGRLLWERTWLTYTRGEQMIGFSLAHQFPELILLGLAGWLGSLLWCIVALIFIFRPRYQTPTVNKVQFALALITLIMTFVPIDKLVLRLRLKEYGYVFQESTGDNQFILMDGRKVTVKNFVADASNEVALKSLQALKWDVLYTNSEGDKIFLRGEYDHQSQSFRLSHWYIKVPFQKLVIEDENYLPFEMHKVTKQSLERTDFETKSDFNPNDPAFDPKSFQKAQ